MPPRASCILEIPLGANGKSADLLYTHSLPYGTGSNDLGLDRGQTSAGRIVRFERIGPKVLLVEPNSALSQLVSRRSRAAFRAPVVPILGARRLQGGGGRCLRRGDGGCDRLLSARCTWRRRDSGESKQGAYKLDPARSVIDLDSTKAFPKNTEVDALLTFTTDAPAGRRSFVADVTPDPHAITVHEHQSFLELPPPGFTPRRFDPRAGYFPSSYRDYSAPLGGELDQQFIMRHRLIKKDPNCTKACEAVAPIQYYVDSGAPEPIRIGAARRRALVGPGVPGRGLGSGDVQGGHAAGGRGPDGCPLQHDPVGAPLHARLELRRGHRRPAHGRDHQGQCDAGQPARTAGLPDRRGAAFPLHPKLPLSSVREAGRSASADPARNPMLAMVLQRLRQLAAHETGHTLGLAHNFAASAFPHGDRRRSSP